MSNSSLDIWEVQKFGDLWKETSGTPAADRPSWQWSVPRPSCTTSSSCRRRWRHRSTCWRWGRWRRWRLLRPGLAGASPETPLGFRSNRIRLPGSRLSTWWPTCRPAQTWNLIAEHFSGRWLTAEGYLVIPSQEYCYTVSYTKLYWPWSSSWLLQLLSLCQNKNNFCTLSQGNIAKLSNVPYFCMYNPPFWQ